MKKLLSSLQQQNLQSLEVEFAPNATWLLKVDAGSGGIMNPTVEWSSYPLKTERLLLAQRLIVSWWSPSVVNGEIIINLSEYRKLDILIRMLILIEETHPDSKVCELSKEDLGKVWVLMLYRVWGNKTDPATGKHTLVSVKEPLAKQMFERATTIFKLWFDAYQSGEVSDGPEFLLSASTVKPALKADIMRHGKDFEEWQIGGSYGSVPFVIAHLLLADALTFIRSSRVKKMLTFFRVVRDTGSYDYLESFWCHGLRSQIGKYRAKSDISILSKTTVSAAANSLVNDCKEKLVRPLHEELLALHLLDEPVETFRFPWKTFTEFQTEYNHIQAAIYIIFLSVMGKRGPSEVRTLRGVDITRADPSTGQDAVIYPSIWKTNKGARQAQGVTNFIDDAIETLLNLGFHDKTHSNLPLFCALPTIKTPTQEPKVLSVDRAQHRLTTYYDEFCKRTINVVDFDVKASHGKISSHQFRHSFAEFALRRFDGNTEELIRQHFCHQYNHWWTKRYTADKIDADQIIGINQRYIRELVPKILRDDTENPEYFGAVALFLKKQFSDAVRVVDANEAEQVIESACEEIEQVTAHEYGWCLLRKDTRNLAKCSDVNGNPNPASTSSDKCIACPSFCASSKSHLEKQTKILLSHMDFIEQKTWSFPRLIKESRQAVHNAQALFPQLKKYGDV